MAGGVQIDENGNFQEGQKQIVEVQKIVYVEDKEKMAKLEKRLANERSDATGNALTAKESRN